MIRFGLFFICLFLTIVSSYAASAPNQSDKSPYHVEITTHLGDNPTFKQGDKISFLVNLNHAAYLTMLYKDASGSVMQIIPNLKSKSNYFEPGVFIQVPGQEASFEFIVQPSFGNEQVWVYATSEPLVELPGVKLGNGLRLLEHDIERLNAMIEFNVSELKLRYDQAFVNLTTQAR